MSTICQSGSLWVCDDTPNLVAPIAQSPATIQPHESRAMSFQPNALTFEEGIQRLTKAARDAGVPQGEVITSRDVCVRQAVIKLGVSNVPSGFNKWQLPVYLDGASQLYLSFGAPNTIVPEHSHDDGDGIRVIISGSIFYKNHELTSGDWMFVPKGKKYSFQVGPQGVGQLNCYQCCCA